MKGKLLIVEDEAPIRETLEQYFTGAGYDCETADGVKSAREKIDENEYDVVIVDKNLPVRGRYKEGGLEVVRSVKLKHPAGGVIIMTGFATIESVVEAMRMGAFDYIIKPFRMEELRGKVDRAIEYRTSLNPDSAMNLYHTLYEQFLELSDRGEKISGKQKHLFLQLVNEKLDLIFHTYRNIERMLLYQRESLANVAALAEQLFDRTPPDDPDRELVEQIANEAHKRL